MGENNAGSMGSETRNPVDVMLDPNVDAERALRMYTQNTQLNNRPRDSRITTVWENGASSGRA